jgi:hypothetical protein
MHSSGPTQRSFTPRELARLQAAYDALMERVGLNAPLGLKEAIAAEMIKAADPFKPSNEDELLLRIEYFLDSRYT